MDRHNTAARDHFAENKHNHVFRCLFVCFCTYLAGRVMVVVVVASKHSHKSIACGNPFTQQSYQSSIAPLSASTIVLYCPGHGIVNVIPGHKILDIKSWT